MTAEEDNERMVEVNQKVEDRVDKTDEPYHSVDAKEEDEEVYHMKVNGHCFIQVGEHGMETSEVMQGYVGYYGEGDKNQEQVKYKVEYGKDHQ